MQGRVILSSIFWLVFLFIVARSIWRFLERAGANGKFEGPLGSPPAEIERPVPGSEEKPRLQIPEYLTRRSEEQPGELHDRKYGRTEPIEEYSETVVLTGEPAQPGMNGRHGRLRPDVPLEVAAVKTTGDIKGRKKIGQKRSEGLKQEDMFSDLLSPDQVVKGMAWAQILGHRGGLRPKR